MPVATVVGSRLSTPASGSARASAGSARCSADEVADRPHPLDRVVDVERDGEAGRDELVAGEVRGRLGADVDRHRHPQRARPARPWRSW